MFQSTDIRFYFAIGSFKDLKKFEVAVSLQFFEWVENDAKLQEWRQLEKSKENKGALFGFIIKIKVSW